MRYLQPGSPMQNGNIERLNRTFIEYVLDAYQFDILEQQRILYDMWQYNYFHPHKSLNRISPAIDAKIHVGVNLPLYAN